MRLLFVFVKMYVVDHLVFIGIINILHVTTYILYFIPYFRWGLRNVVHLVRSVND